MEVVKMEIKNFKGIKKFFFEANGKDVNIRGNNATGKTSVLDAFCWVLTGKDSKGDSDTKFEIRPINDDGSIKPDITSSVEIELSNPEVKLKKIYHEVYRTPKGTTERVFEGCTSDYYIDDEPLKQSEFNNRLKEIFDPELIPVISNATHFGSLAWKKKREMLSDIFGILSDEELYEMKKEFKVIPDILGKKNIEAMKKILREQMKDIQKDLDSFQARMDENEDKIIQLDEKELKKVEKNIKDKEKEVDDLRKEIANLENGKSISDIENDISKKENQKEKLELELNKLEQNKDEVIREQLKDKHEELNKLTDEKMSLTTKKMYAEKDIETLETRIKTESEALPKLEDGRKELLESYNETNKEVFPTFKEDTLDNLKCEACQYCKYEFAVQEEKAEAIKKEAFDKWESDMKAFDKDKKEKLDRIVKKGTELKQKIEEKEKLKQQLKENLENMKKELFEISALLDKNSGQRKNIEKDIEAFKKTQPKVEDSKEYKDIVKQIETAEKEITESKEKLSTEREGIKEKVSEIEQKISDIKKEIEEESKKLNAKRDNEMFQERIKELEEENKKNVKMYSEKERDLNLLTNFENFKASKVEEEVNKHFKYCKFRMFKMQKNGDIAQDCEILVDGVPYTSNLNTASRINAGLDIVNVISEKIGFKAPVFIDNRESVVEVIESESQIISLIVDEKASKLKAEVK